MRLWHHPPKIVVWATLDKPKYFIWQKETHQIMTCHHWRFDTGWWRLRRSWRDYFKVTTDTGLLALISHDLVIDTWYMEKLYD